MRHLRILLVLLPLLLSLAARAGAVEIFPLSELRPGMQGTAFTVFRGDSITAFSVEVIDRVPGRGPFDLVLIRGGDELEAQGGISKGMSGSPVYIQGRWLEPSPTSARQVTVCTSSHPYFWRSSTRTPSSLWNPAKPVR